MLLSQYDGFVLCVQPGELIPPSSLGSLYTDTPRGGVSSRGIILLRGRAPRLAPARPPDQSDVVLHDSSLTYLGCSGLGLNTILFLQGFCPQILFIPAPLLS